MYGGGGGPVGFDDITGKQNISGHRQSYLQIHQRIGIIVLQWIPSQHDNMDVLGTTNNNKKPNIISKRTIRFTYQ